uniref:Uncharacterized protein n=1 Tax=Romanomermis culicivorax TaxID=13658 RepID=A0A915HX85_ROMCU
MTRANNKRSVTFSKKNDIQSSSHENSKSNNGYYLPPVGKPLKPSPSMATLSRLERQNILLWKRPLLTLNYSIRELLLVLYESFCKLTRNKLLLVGLCLLSFCIYCLHTIHGPHTPIFDVLERKASWWIYWIFLGILSSVGLGTGLHTFLLYLGPHIAAVTLAAYECQTLRFPEPPYPNQILCPGEGVESTNYNNGKFFSNHSNNGNYTASSFGESSSSATDDLFDATIGTLAASSMISLWAIMSKNHQSKLSSFSFDISSKHGFELFKS